MLVFHVLLRLILQRHVFWAQNLNYLFGLLDIYKYYMKIKSLILKKNKETWIIDDAFKHALNTDFTVNFWFLKLSPSTEETEKNRLDPCLLVLKVMFKSWKQCTIITKLLIFLRCYNTGGHRNFKDYKGRTFNSVCFCCCDVLTRNAFKTTWELNLDLTHYWH